MQKNDDVGQFAGLVAVALALALAGVGANQQHVNRAFEVGRCDRLGVSKVDAIVVQAVGDIPNRVATDSQRRAKHNRETLNKEPADGAAF